MRHFASASFWKAYEALPEQIRRQADNQYELLKADPRHPSLYFKRVIGRRSRALGTEADGGLIWFWIGSHAEYDRMIG
jgi:hypothetical protein